MESWACGQVKRSKEFAGTLTHIQSGRLDTTSAGISFGPSSTSTSVLIGVTALNFFKQVRACWDAVFLSRYTSYLETENAALRARIGWMEQKLSEQKLPMMQTADVKPADGKKIPNQVGGVATFWNAEVRKKVRKDLFENDPASAPAEEPAANPEETVHAN